METVSDTREQTMAVDGVAKHETVGWNRGYEDGYQGRRYRLELGGALYLEAYRAGRVDRWHDDHVCPDD